jgi:hypothetical protein
MNSSLQSSRRNAVVAGTFRLVAWLLPTISLMCLVAGCGKKDASADADSSPAAQQSTAPGPAPTPAVPTAIQPADNGDINATLAQLTRELHRTMIGRRLNRNFDEFVALRNLQVPPPPQGKKYAISQQWKVVLVNN